MKYIENQIITHKLNGITLVYAMRGGVTAFTCVPSGTENLIISEKLLKLNKGDRYPEIDPMVQIALKGDEPRRDFSAGATTFNYSASYSLKFSDQKVIKTDEKTEIITYFKNDGGLNVKHVVRQANGYRAIEVFAEIENAGEKSITLDRASSFTINSLTPFSAQNDMQNLVLHRLRSNWSAEGRKESLPLKNFDFEDSWSCLGVRVERFGALGSMPARGFIPFVALEDKNAGVTWAVQQDAVSSWQIEALHRYGSVSLSGGVADRLFGHWRKTLNKGEVFITPSAYVSAVKGDLTAACAALTDYHDNLLNLPRSEQDLPVVYNEYLFSWGRPTIENIKPQLKIARDLGAEYFVIDAGWFSAVNDDSLGDWLPVKEKFPNGLSEFSNIAAERGVKKCGVWFEFESVTENSEVFKLHKDWLLTDDGEIIMRNGRAFLDFRKTEVIDYLSRRVIERLKSDGLKYIKIDYNENVGFSVDGDESPAEGLRKHMLGVASFMKKLRDEVPDLVMEVCSSGGMRHSAFFDTIGSMVSFSDAHENADGAVVAMDLHRVMQPRVMQIWASVLPKHTSDEIYFTLVKAMLGRICISGKAAELSAENFNIVKSGINYYQKIKDVIKSGETVLIDTDEITSLCNPNGVIRLLRKSKDGKKMLAYALCFGAENRVAEFNVAGYKLNSWFGNAKAEQGKVIFGGKQLSAAVCEYVKVE